MLVVTDTKTQSDDSAPAGLQASFCFALETTMELLHYFLTTLAKTDRMTIRDDCTSEAFAEYAEPCLSTELLRLGHKSNGGLHARASCLKLPHLAAYELPVAVVSAFAGDALTTRTSTDVVFGQAQYTQRQQRLQAHVTTYVTAVRQYLRLSFTHVMLACVRVRQDVHGLLARITPRAVLEMRRRFLSRRILPNEAADPSCSCLGNVLLHELLKRPVKLFTDPKEHGEDVGVLLSLYLRDRSVVRYLTPLPSDVHYWSGPFSASHDVELFTTPGRCLELIAALYDVKTDELDIAQYLALPDAAGAVCPAAVVARLMAANYTTPVGIQTLTEYRLKLQRGRIMAAVNTTSELLQGLRRGLHCSPGVGDMDALFVEDAIDLALHDILTTCVMDCDVSVDSLRTAVRTADDGAVDLFPAFVAAVAIACSNENVTKVRPWVRPCFRDLPTLCDADSVSACCVERHEYHHSVLSLLGMDAICDCRHVQWTEIQVDDVHAAAFTTSVQLVLLCGRRLPTLSLHNLHKATPQRCARMALLANVATQAALHAFKLVRETLPRYGTCANGHPCCLPTVFWRVIDFEASIDTVFTCFCGAKYVESELLPFFTTSHATIFKARVHARRTRVIDKDGDENEDEDEIAGEAVCLICNTTRSRIPNGGVSVCSICGDVTCLTCGKHAHPGSLCSISLI